MNRKAIVIAARTCLVMLVVAAIALLGLGLASLLLADPPEPGGWLRSVFGRVFAVTAIGGAVVLGTPAAVGLWAMAGAGADDATPALEHRARIAVSAVAAGTIAITVLVCLITGSVVVVLNVGLVALVALASIGLGGAAAMSPHRGRAVLAGITLVVVAGATMWFLGRAFVATGG